MGNIKHKIQSPNDFHLTETGSHGVFVCDSSHPFDADTVGKKGFVFACYNSTKEDVILSSKTVNGVYGAGLGNTFMHGTSLAIEIEAMAVTQGIVYIYLKKE